MKQVAALILAVFLSAMGAESEVPAVMNSRQCLLVTTPSWSSTQGVLRILERDSDVDSWRQRGPKIPVVLGKKGLAWSRDVRFVASSAWLNSPAESVDIGYKVEGDNKAPAGLFSLKSVFGYASRAKTRMPYLYLTSTIFGVDDPKSRYYNQVVDSARIESRDWHSAEQMRRNDIRYKWGVIVDYNNPPHAGAGSCIFLHVWLGPDVPTVGCTAMSEKNLVEIIRWLDPAKNPLLLQLPAAEYEEYRQTWNLPPLP